MQPHEINIEDLIPTDVEKIHTNKKVGRPKKQETEKRDHSVMVNFTKEEEAALSLKANEEGLAKATLIRKFTLMYIGNNK